MSGGRAYLHLSSRPSWGQNLSNSRSSTKKYNGEAVAKAEPPKRASSAEPSRAWLAERAEMEQKRHEQRVAERQQAERIQVERQQAEMRRKRAEEVRQRVQDELSRHVIRRSNSVQSKSAATSTDVPPSPRRSKGMHSPSRTARFVSVGSARGNRGRSPRSEFEPCSEEVSQRLEAERKRIEEEQVAERQRCEAEQRRLQAEASSRRIAEAGVLWYNVLDLPATACVDEVKRAFRELALMHHPDKSFETCDDTFKRVQVAYQQGLRLARPCSTSQGPSRGSSCSFMPPDRAPVVEKDGRRKLDKVILITASADHTVRLWEMSTGECERTIWAHTRGVVSLSKPADGGLFVTGSWDRTAKIWNVADGSCIMTIQPNCGHRTTSMMVKPCISWDGKQIAMVCEDSAVRIWSLDSGECQRTFRGHSCNVKCACFSPDGKYLVTGSIDRLGRVWKVCEGKLQHVLKGHQGSVNFAAFSPDGTHVVTASEDCSALIWNVETGKAVRKLKGHTNTVNSICFTTDGAAIATGSEDGIARVWNASTGECTQMVAPEVARMAGITSVAFSPDGSLLATGSHDHKTRVWCLKSGVCEFILRKHEDSVSAVTFLKLPD